MKVERELFENKKGAGERKDEKEKQIGMNIVKVYFYFYI